MRPDGWDREDDAFLKMEFQHTPLATLAREMGQSPRWLKKRYKEITQNERRRSRGN